MDFVNMLKVGILLIMLIKISQAETIQYIYDLECNDINKQIEMTIKQDGENIEITFVREKSDKQIISFINKVKPTNVEYINASGKKIREVKYNYFTNKIIISGDNNSEINYKKNTFDNNGSLFYIFSYLFPTTSSNLNFLLLESKDNKIVNMYLKYRGKEQIDIQGGKNEAYKYEMGLEGFIPSMFWPYKYYYWYSTQERKFLKYQGPRADKKIETIVLKSEIKVK